MFSLKSKLNYLWKTSNIRIINRKLSDKSIQIEETTCFGTTSKSSIQIFQKITMISHSNHYFSVSNSRIIYQSIFGQPNLKYGYSKINESTKNAKGEQIHSSPMIDFILKLKTQNPKAISINDLKVLENNILYQGLTVRNLDELQIIMEMFTQKNFGNKELYAIFSEKALLMMSQQQHYSILNSNTWNLIEQFTKANFISEELFQFFEKNIDKVLSPEILSKNIRWASLISEFAFFLALHYSKTTNLHDSFLQILTKEVNQDPQYLYSHISNINKLRQLWSFLQTLYINNKSKFQFLKDNNVIGKIPFKYSGFQVSNEQKEIQQMLLQLVPKEKVEIEKMIGIYHVDILFDSNIVIEINGFKHYFNDGERRSGEYQIKYNNLISLKYSVKEIKVKDWRNMASLEAKNRFLRELLGL